MKELRQPSSTISSEQRVWQLRPHQEAAVRVAILAETPEVVVAETPEAVVEAALEATHRAQPKAAAHRVEAPRQAVIHSLLLPFWSRSATTMGRLH
jgi:hypothetical protein